MSRNSCGARPQEGTRHAVRKFRGTISMKKATEDRNEDNSEARLYRLRIVNHETKSLRLNSVQNGRMSGALYAYQTGPCMMLASGGKGVGKLLETPKNVYYIWFSNRRYMKFPVQIAISGQAKDVYC